MVPRSEMQHTANSPFVVSVTPAKIRLRVHLGGVGGCQYTTSQNVADVAEGTRVDG